MSTSGLNRTNSFFISIIVCCRIRDSDGSENKVYLFTQCLYLLFSPANLKVRGTMINPMLASWYSSFVILLRIPALVPLPFISCRIPVANLGPSVFRLEKVKSPGD